MQNEDPDPFIFEIASGLANRDESPPKDGPQHRQDHGEQNAPSAWHVMRCSFVGGVVPSVLPVRQVVLQKQGWEAHVQFSQLYRDPRVAALAASSVGIATCSAVPI